LVREVLLGLAGLAAQMEALVLIQFLELSLQLAVVMGHGISRTVEMAVLVVALLALPIQLLHRMLEEVPHQDKVMLVVQQVDSKVQAGAVQVR
jgi:hypothetical protein